MERSVNAEVIASTFDEPIDRHVKIAEIVLSKAQRMVECGHDVVILLDPITPCPHTTPYNLPQENIIRGVDANALHKPKRFWCSTQHRKWRLLTIIATALIDTGSKMDEVILKNLKYRQWSSTRCKLSNKRIFPQWISMHPARAATTCYFRKNIEQNVDIAKSLGRYEFSRSYGFLLTRLKRTKNNEEFLLSMND